MPANLENSAVATGLEKLSFSFQAQRRAMSKNCCFQIAVLYASKVVLKILQARLQQCVNLEFPDVRDGSRKGRGIRDQIDNIHLIIKKAREFQKKHLLLLDHNKLWKILKQMGIPDHLTSLLRNLCAGQESAVITGHGTTDCF